MILFVNASTIILSWIAFPSVPLTGTCWDGMRRILAALWEAWAKEDGGPWKPTAQEATNLQLMQALKKGGR